MATNSSRIPGDAWRTPRALDWPAPAPGVLVAAAARGRTALDAVRHEALKDGMYLVPVRAFIGIGWLRAFAEKITQPGWSGHPWPRSSPERSHRWMSRASIT
jgi:hypothetical protein